MTATAAVARPAPSAMATSPESPRIAYRMINLPARRWKRRVMELQFRVLGIDASAFAALDGERGREVFPASAPAGR